ncbi:MAG: acyl-CoA thioesterase [Rhodospirillales bacterium]|nr:acyl-CoA thioesterase [Rhodospirillales bacterium]
MFSDCDPAKIMFYPRYFQWFDRASQQIFNEVGLPWNETWAQYDMGGFPLVDASASFKAPARMDETVQMETWIDEWRGRTFVVKHVVSRDGEILVEGQEIRVWAVHDASRPAGIRAAEIPEEIKAKFEV